MFIKSTRPLHTTTSRDQGFFQKKKKRKKKKRKKKDKPRRRHKPRSKRTRSECIEKTLPSLIQTGDSSSIHLNLGCLALILSLGLRTVFCMDVGGSVSFGARALRGPYHSSYVGIKLFFEEGGPSQQLRGMEASKPRRETKAFSITIVCLITPMMTLHFGRF